MFLMAGTVPLILIGIAAWNKIEADLTTQIVREHQVLVRQVRLNIRADLKEFRSRLNRLARTRDLQALDPRRSRGALEEFQSLNPAFRSVILYDIDGYPLSHAGHDEPSEGDRLPSGVLDRLKSGATPDVDVRATNRQSEAGHMRFLTFIERVPSFLNDGTAVGVVVGRVHIFGLALQRMLDDWEFIGDTRVYLVSSDGEVLASLGDVGKTVVRRIHCDQGMGGRDADQEPSIGRSTMDGEDLLLAVTGLPEIDLRVIAARPYSQVQKFLPELLGAIGSYVALGILFSAILGVFLASSLVKPILRLTDGIQRVSRGELAHRLEVGRSDEIGQAGAAFNDLVSYLHRTKILEETWTLRQAPSRSLQDSRPDPGQTTRDVDPPQSETTENQDPVDPGQGLS